MKTGKETASSCGRTLLYYHILGLYIYIYIIYIYIYYIYGKYLAAPQTLATFARHLVGKKWLLKTFLVCSSTSTRVTCFTEVLRSWSLVCLNNEGLQYLLGFSVGVVDSKQFKNTNLLRWHDLQAQVFHMCIVIIWHSWVLDLIHVHSQVQHIIPAIPQPL